MDKYVILYNPLSHKGNGKENASKLKDLLKGAEISFEDMTAVKDTAAYMQSVPADTKVVFTGGDGTLNRVINALDGVKLNREIYYFPAGSGNDFIRDLHKKKNCEPFPINEYMEGLPSVLVKGITCKFINAIGAGMDGFCCEESDRLNALGKSKSYARIAMEGLLGKYKPNNAAVTVDGIKKEYRYVWMAPTMFGSYYGGGFKMGPEQDRKDPDHTVTSVTIHGVSRFLAPFLFIFVMKGKGGSFRKYLSYRKGRHVRVDFSSPVAIQIDGETVLNVTHYEVIAAPVK